MKIFLDTIGCRLNQAEIELLAGRFRAAGHEIVPGPEGADLVVVNTCTVTSEAASDSRAAIRRASRAGASQVAVTGCWATLAPEQASSLPGVIHVIPNVQKDDLAAKVLGMPILDFELEPLVRRTLPGNHLRTRAFIKVQDGCDDVCTFCITRLARGPSRSRSLDDIQRDIHSALLGGAREIVLTGVQLGAWGHDLQPSRHLSDLLAALLKNADLSRLRLSSLEPWDLEPAFFQLWQDPRLCPHLHLPLQSGSATVLRRMRRKPSPPAYAALVQAARQAIPQLAVTTDLIAGFPGESEEEFAQCLDFVREMHFLGGHVFSYSPRPGTPAAKMKDQVPHALARQRAAMLRAALAESALEYHRTFIGQTLPVLWEARTTETPQGWQVEGLSDNYIRVTATACEPRWNQVESVRITGASPEGCSGEIQPAGQDPV